MMPRQGKLTLELVELSRNKTIREMFTNEKAGNEINVFVKQHHLHLNLTQRATGEPDGFELTGDSAALREFLGRYLGDDAETGVYLFRE